MIWHPLMLSILLMDGMSFFLLFASAVTRIHMLLEWAPASADNTQIALERRVERADALQPAAVVIYAASSLAWVMGIADILPALVPGAMCGTGVMQAANGAGGRALAFRLLALIIFYCADAVRRMDRQDPDGILAIPFARISLIALPFAVLGSGYTVTAILGMAVRQPVDCCAVVYDAVQGTVSGGGPLFPGSFLMGIMGLHWLFIPVLGVWVLKRWSAASLTPVFLFFIATLGFIFSGAAALINVLSPYFYHVLHHHCPWCFFLPEHRFVGFPLFAALLVAGAEGVVPFIAVGLYKSVGGIHFVVQKRVKQAVLSVVLSTALFVLMAMLPAVLWRLRYGVWMTG